MRPDRRRPGRGRLLPPRPFELQHRGSGLDFDRGQPRSGRTRWVEQDRATEHLFRLIEAAEGPGEASSGNGSATLLVFRRWRSRLSLRELPIMVELKRNIPRAHRPGTDAPARFRAPVGGARAGDHLPHGDLVPAMVASILAQAANASARVRIQPGRKLEMLDRLFVTVFVVAAPRPRFHGGKWHRLRW